MAKLYIGPVLNGKRKYELRFSFNYSGAEVDNIQYNVDGSNWVNANFTYGSTKAVGTFIVENLIPNTTYTVNVRARNKNDGIWAYGSVVYTTQEEEIKIKINGKWKEGTPYLKRNGVWEKTSTYSGYFYQNHIYYKIDGNWKLSKYDSE